MASCPRCGGPIAEEAKFCSQCGAPVAPLGEQRKTVTVLFADVAGSTELGAELDPEVLRAVMTRYFDSARAAIERHGGVVEKFIGDAVMAVFGVPAAHEDDALRAVRAAQELRDAVELPVRIGLNTGTVMTGDGDSSFVTGDAVNVAARLEQAAGAGEVLLGARTHRLVRAVVRAETIPPLLVKGKAKPLEAYRLLEITAEPRRRHAAPMVGRGHELDLLRQGYERASTTRACELLTILGGAGIGKSRLCNAFLAELHDQRVLTGRCLSYGEGITYWPVVEVLKQLGPQALPDTVAQPLAAVRGDSTARTTPPETAWAVRKAFEAAALHRPLVVVFDDIHWGEATFLDLVEQVVLLSRDAPIFVLCMARPELLDRRPGWGAGHPAVTTVTLGPLPEAETTTLARSLLDSDDEQLLGRITAAAEGNPLFLEEMAELVRDTGSAPGVPPTIHALLTARLDTLPLEERVVLQCGSIEGQVFHRTALLTLARDEQEPDVRLSALIRKELIEPGEPTFVVDDAYRFRHLLIRDVAYDALPKAARLELHDRYAGWLDDRDEDLVERDEIVGYHLEQAAHYARELMLTDRDFHVRAAARLREAALRADLNGDAAATVNLARRALELLAPDHANAVELLPLVAKALYDTGQLDDADSVLDRALDSNDRVVVARAQVLRARMAHSSSSRYRERLAELDAAISVFEAVGDDAALAEAHQARSTVLFFAGRNRDALAAAVEAVERARRAKNVPLEVLAVESRGAAMAWSSVPWPEVDRYTRSIIEEPRLGPRAHARALRGLALGLWAQEKFAEARATFAQARHQLRELGLVLQDAAHPIAVAHMEWAAGDWHAMERHARESWERLGELGEHGYRSTAGLLLAEALLRLHHVHEAKAVLAEAEGLASPDDYTARYTTLALHGMVSAHEQDVETAGEFAKRALSVVDNTDASEHQIVARIIAAEIAASAGQIEEATRLVADAGHRATNKKNHALARRARLALEGAPRSPK